MNSKPIQMVDPAGEYRSMKAEIDAPSFALSYQPENTAARALYASLGFVETGEQEDDEVVARRPK